MLEHLSGANKANMTESMWDYKFFSNSFEQIDISSSFTDINVNGVHLRMSLIKISMYTSMDIHGYFIRYNKQFRVC